MLMMNNWNSQLYMHLVFNGTASLDPDPAKQEDNMDVLIMKQSLNIFLLQSIIVKNHYNSKYHFWIIVIMLVVLVSVVFSAER